MTIKIFNDKNKIIYQHTSPFLVWVYFIAKQYPEIKKPTEVCDLLEEFMIEIRPSQIQTIEDEYAEQTTVANLILITQYVCDNWDWLSILNYPVAREELFAWWEERGI